MENPLLPPGPSLRSMRHTPHCVQRLQREEVASKQQELDRVQRAYERIKDQERHLEEALSHISEEIKGRARQIKLAYLHLAPQEVFIELVTPVD